MRKVDLPDKVLMSLLLFLGHSHFIKFQILSKNWFCRIDSLFSNLSTPLEKGFGQMYSDYLTIVNKKLVYSDT